MADDLGESIARIEGTLSVIKGWGIGLASIAIGLSTASLVVVATVLYQLGSMSTQVDQIQQATEAQLNRDQFREILREVLATEADTPKTGSPAGLARDAKP